MPAPRKPMNYRLGLDVGTGSLGWAVLELDHNDRPFRVERLGSRIFGTGRHPKDQTTLAGNRTAARASRRRRDRYIYRRNQTLKTLVRYGLMPKDRAERQALVSLHPFRLRHEAIRARLELHHVGRAIFHLQQRRGFKSNRKADRGDSDSGAMKMAIKEFQQKIPNDETVGSYLWQEITKGGTARARHHKVGVKTEYDFYVDRAMVEDEFERIWEYQAQIHPEVMTPEAHDAIHHAIFFQRPLKPVDPGKCFFYRKDPRAEKALPSSQQFRLYQEVNNLRVRDATEPHLKARPLTREERDKAIAVLRKVKESKFASFSKKVFGARSSMIFNLEEGERASIGGDIMAWGMSKADAFGPLWEQFTLEQQDDIVSQILDLESEEDAEQLIQTFVDNFDITHQQASYIVNDTRIPEGHLRVSTRAVYQFLPHMVDGWSEDLDAPVTYDRAVALSGLDHSVQESGTAHDFLPYYGQILNRYTADVPRREDPVVKRNTDADEWEWGRIANPTVHIGLNQIRKVVNALIKEYGKPAQVYVELARELGQSKEDRARASSRRNDNEKENKRLTEVLNDRGEKSTYANRERLRLYEELKPLNHVCVLCGRPIELGRIFTNDYQVDHILPFSKTLDDSFANKMLIHHHCNQFKANRTPWEAYGSDQVRWNGIADRIESLPANKTKRFTEDALENYNVGGGDFIARQLTDTAYLARVTRYYMGALYGSNEDVQRSVFVTPGRLTGMLRGKWGLNSLLGDTGAKVRSDHRHHAVDAAVVAVTDRKILKDVTDANRRAREYGAQRLLEDMPLPWETFREDMREGVDRIIVSHRPDHGVGGQLHEDTAYGVLDGPDKHGQYLTRKKKEGRWEEPKWRKVIPLFREGEGPDSALPYKAYIGGSNYCMEIVRTSAGRWEGEVISRFEANQPSYRAFMQDRARFRKESASGRPLVMRLVANDTIAIGHGEERQLFRLYKMTTNKQMFFAEINEGNIDARVRSGELKPLSSNPDPLRKRQARRVFIDELGTVKDPGFRE